MNIKIDKNSFNYSRFVTHFDYMLKRIKESKQATMLDKDVFKMLIEKYPENYKAAKCIQEILFENEKFYFASSPLLAAFKYALIKPSRSPSITAFTLPFSYPVR